MISRAVTPAVEGMATAGQIAVELRAYADGDLDGAWYAIACTDEPETNAAVVAEATASRIFCVRADIARDGTAVTPATARYDGLTLGVLAGGEHRRSAAVRNRAARSPAVRCGDRRLRAGDARASRSSAAAPATPT